MNRLSKVFVGITVSTAAVVAGTLAGYAIAGAVPPPEPELKVLSEAELSVSPVDRFPVNAAGQTLGLVDQGLLTDHTARAELILVTTDDGQDGYAYYDELLPGLNVSGEGNAGPASRGEPYEVAVYEIDGTTVIGYQTVNRPAK